jgi:hypothetical protein
MQGIPLAGKAVAATRVRRKSDHVKAITTILAYCYFNFVQLLARKTNFNKTRMAANWNMSVISRRVGNLFELLSIRFITMEGRNRRRCYTKRPPSNYQSRLVGVHRRQ